VPAGANGLGQLSGLLPRDHLTEESAIQVNLSNETVWLPLYPGIAYKGTSHQAKVWYMAIQTRAAGSDAPSATSSAGRASGHMRTVSNGR
jgi:hypothetical protein